MSDHVTTRFGDGRGQHAHGFLNRPGGLRQARTRAAPRSTADRDPSKEPSVSHSDGENADLVVLAARREIARIEEILRTLPHGDPGREVREEELEVLRCVERGGGDTDALFAEYEETPEVMDAVTTTAGSVRAVDRADLPCRVVRAPHTRADARRRSSSG
jgi:hypothetical protein